MATFEAQQEEVAILDLPSGTRLQERRRKSQDHKQLREMSESVLDKGTHDVHAITDMEVHIGSTEMLEEYDSDITGTFSSDDMGAEEYLLNDSDPDSTESKSTVKVQKKTDKSEREGCSTHSDLKPGRMASYGTFQHREEVISVLHTDSVASEGCEESVQCHTAGDMSLQSPEASLVKLSTSVQCPVCRKIISRKYLELHLNNKRGLCRNKTDMGSKKEESGVVDKSSITRKQQRNGESPETGHFRDMSEIVCGTSTDNVQSVTDRSVDRDGAAIVQKYDSDRTGTFSNDTVTGEEYPLHDSDTGATERKSRVKAKERRDTSNEDGRSTYSDLNHNKIGRYSSFSHCDALQSQEQRDTTSSGICRERVQCDTGGDVNGQPPKPSTSVKSNEDSSTGDGDVKVCKDPQCKIQVKHQHPEKAWSREERDSSTGDGDVKPCKEHRCNIQVKQQHLKRTRRRKGTSGRQGVCRRKPVQNLTQRSARRDVTAECPICERIMTRYNLEQHLNKKKGWCSKNTHNFTCETCHMQCCGALQFIAHCETHREPFAAGRVHPHDSDLD